MMQRQELIGMPRDKMEQMLVSMGEPRFRGAQLYHAIYRERQLDLAKVTTIPKALRDKVTERFQATLPEVERVYRSTDGTARYLLRLSDGKEIESVFMPEESRKTLCISTQVGCPVDCQFCLTGVMGFTRNLTAGEIMCQVLRLCTENRWPASEKINLVFM